LVQNEQTMEIRPMEPSDWPAVKAIYEQGIATRNATFEEKAPSWEEWDAEHLAAPRLGARLGGLGRRLSRRPSAGRGAGR
jgi:phosphinothricin acetyltransferase